MHGNQPIATLTDTAAVRDDNTTITRLIPFMIDLSTTGFYVAFRGHGTCISLVEIVEVTVFYPVCDAVVLKVGTSFLEIGLPGIASFGVCFANMVISIEQLVDSFTATCMPTSKLMPPQQTDRLFTSWTDSGDALQPCICLPGYILSYHDHFCMCTVQVCMRAYLKIIFS